MRLAAIGDNCVDFYEKQGWAYPGGNAVNVAVYGRQLGMDAAYLGWIGTDNFGDTGKTERTRCGNCSHAEQTGENCYYIH